tara:strand:- start:829 stop:1647 length:819 start_codon:yes stop_codon:yes gene_type:complete
MDRGKEMTISKSAMGKTAIVWSCAHASPETKNERFDWLGGLVYDIKPDYCIDLGDGADMKSLNMYDKAKPKSAVAKNYGDDIESYDESQELLRYRFKQQRRRRPKWYGFEGNHEARITTAISYDPHLEHGKYGISFTHLNTNKWFDEYHPYENGAPAIYNYDGVDYAHFVGSGNFGRAISGTHHAYALLQKRYRSCSVGHSHKRDMYFKEDVGARGGIGAVVGCFKGASESWAGQSNGEWWKGVLIKRNIQDGQYEPQWVSMETLKQTYGGK